MRLPSKVTPYSQSVMARLPRILKVMQERDYRPSELYHKVKGKNMSLAEFIEALDCLFLLGQVEFINGREALHYVARDSVQRIPR